MTESKEPFTLYRADPTSVAKVTSETRAYGKDSDGQNVWQNTHFPDIADAWERVLDESAAGARLAADAVESARAKLEKEEKRLVEASLTYHKARENYHAFVREHYPDKAGRVDRPTHPGNRPKPSA
jgi:hypothetical protein